MTCACVQFVRTDALRTSVPSPPMEEILSDGENKNPPTLEDA